jgi:hypothetical protein
MRKILQYLEEESISKGSVEDFFDYEREVSEILSSFSKGNVKTRVYLLDNDNDIRFVFNGFFEITSGEFLVTTGSRHDPWLGVDPRQAKKYIFSQDGSDYFLDLDMKKG